MIVSLAKNYTGITIIFLAVFFFLSLPANILTLNQMKNQVRSFAIILLLLLSCSCRHDNHDGLSDVKVIAGYDNEPKANGDGLGAEIVRTVKLETTADNLLRTVNKVAVVEDSIIVVADNAIVQSYGMDGHYRCQFGSKGNGGDEYITMSGFYVNDNDEVIIIDSYRNALMRYDINGNYVGKDELDHAVLNNVRNGVAYNNSSVFLSKELTTLDAPAYVVYDIESSAVLSEIPSPLQSADVPYLIGQNPMCRRDGHILALLPFSQYIYDCDGSQVYKFETDKALATEQQLQGVTNMGLSFEMYSNGGFTGFTDIFETDSHLFCMFLNAEYTVVDKEQLVCQRYSYTSGLKLTDGINPLVNIVGCHGDQIIGNLFYNSMYVRSEIIEELMKRWNCETDDNANPVLIFYRI